VLFGLCRSKWVNKCLSFFLVPSRSSNTPLYPQSVANQGACPKSLLFHCFHFRLTSEFIKELGSVSLIVMPMQRLHFILHHKIIFFSKIHNKTTMFLGKETIEALNCLSCHLNTKLCLTKICSLGLKYSMNFSLLVF
jgi:hypothetical protein